VKMRVFGVVVCTPACLLSRLSSSPRDGCSSGHFLGWLLTADDATGRQDKKSQLVGWAMKLSGTREGAGSPAKRRGAGVGPRRRVCAKPCRWPVPMTNLGLCITGPTGRQYGTSPTQAPRWLQLDREAEQRVVRVGARPGAVRPPENVVGVPCRPQPSDQKEQSRQARATGARWGGLQ